MSGEVLLLTHARCIAALRKIPAEDLCETGQKHFSLGTWSLVKEKGPKAIWKHSPVHSLMQGDYQPDIKEVILGVNRDEGMLVSLVHMKTFSYTRLGTLFSMALQLQKPENLKGMYSPSAS